MPTEDKKYTYHKHSIKQYIQDTYRKHFMKQNIQREKLIDIIEKEGFLVERMTHDRRTEKLILKISFPRESKGTT